ncbi:hypothetical protein ACFFGH_06685 [Lysobacter korlensis]|uniref:Uncharacterized protein n=1 Tax=Lysobacter korlensis TaxID=553636 RepID=A0ABV6RL68_9GAMM
MDFTWHPYLRGPGLAFNGLFVALLENLDDGRARVVLHPNLPAKLRHEFVESEAHGRRYVEAWTKRWDSELRELYGPGGAIE